MISAKYRSEIPLGEEEEVEGKYHHLFIECEVYMRQENILVLYLGKGQGYIAM